MFFLMKTFSLFLPCNMAAVQNLYSDFVQQVMAHSSQINEGERTTIRSKKKKKRQYFVTMGSKILDLGESRYRPGTSGMQNGRSII